MFWWTVPLVFGTIIGLMIGLYAPQRMRRPAGYFMSAAGILVAWWCLTEWISLLGVAEDYRTVLAKLQYIGCVSVPVLWSCTAIAHSGYTKFLDQILRFIWIIPAITLALVFSNEYHQQIWQTFDVVPGSSQLDITYGPWFWVHASYSYFIVIGSTAALAFRIGLDNGNRFRLIALIAGPALVTLVNIIYVLGPRLPTDPTPVAFAVSCLLLLIALRQNMLSVRPVARRYAVEKLIDGVVVIDDQGCIADCNPAATAIFGRENTQLGQIFADLFPAGVDLNDKSGSAVQLADGRWLDIHTSRFDTHDGPVLGRVCLIRDVTKEKILQETIAKAQQELGDTNARMREQRQTDQSKQLATHSYMYERLQEEWSRSSRHGTALTLVLLSFDSCKGENDIWEHLDGDMVLDRVSEKLSGLIRPEDIAARHVGRQVAVLLPSTNERQGAEFARRILRTLCDMQYQNDRKESFSITVSAGVASRSQTADSVDYLLSRAQTALYQSKHSGPNSVSVASASGLVRLEPVRLSPISMDIRA